MLVYTNGHLEHVRAPVSVVLLLYLLGIDVPGGMKNKIVTQSTCLPILAGSLEVGIWI